MQTVFEMIKIKAIHMENYSLSLQPKVNVLLCCLWSLYCTSYIKRFTNQHVLAENYQAKLFSLPLEIAQLFVDVS